jgi:hypothetical protein
MIIQKTSQYSGKIHQMDISILPSDLERFNTDQTANIDKYFPDLTDDEKTFLIAGMNAEETNLNLGL